MEEPSSPQVAGRTNFHLCINQTGMWVQLIALGRHPTSKHFFFSSVGPVHCRQDEQLDGYCPSLSWVGRIHVSKMHKIIVRVSGLGLLRDLYPNEDVPQPSGLFPFPDQLENIRVFSTVGMDNMTMFLHVSLHILNWNNVSIFLYFGHCIRKNSHPHYNHSGDFSLIPQTLPQPFAISAMDIGVLIQHIILKHGSV